MLGTISSSSNLPAFSASSTLLLASGANLLRGDLAAFSQLAYFGCDDRKTLAMFASARRFDGGIECQQIGLVSDVVDDADLLRDLLHCGNGCLDLASPPFGGLVRGLGGDAVGDFGVVGVLRN